MSAFSEAEWRPDERQSRFLGPINSIGPRNDGGARAQILQVENLRPPRTRWVLIRTVEVTPHPPRRCGARSPLGEGSWFKFPAVAASLPRHTRTQIAA